MKLSKTQQEILDQIAVGETVEVSTSQFNDWRVIRKNLNDSGFANRRIIPGNAKAVEGLIKRGLLTGKCCFRSFTVTRVAA